MVSKYRTPATEDAELNKTMKVPQCPKNKTKQNKQKVKHMKQAQYKTIAALITAGTTAAGGAEKLSATVPLTHNKAASLRALVDDIMKAGEAYHAGKKELADRRKTLLEVIDESRDFMMSVRDSFKNELGHSHGPGWLLTGWERSFRVSGKAAVLLPHICTTRDFMVANPSFEVAQFNITAAEADVFQGKLSTAIVALNEQKTIVGTLLAARNEARRKLSRGLSGLFQELRNFLTPLDQRWKTYGFNIPGAPATPETPTNVIATLVGAHAVSVKWTAAVRAENYRVSMRILGVNEEFVSKGLPGDLDFTIEGLASGAQIEIVVSAINAGGESAPSNVVKVTMPVAG